MSTQTFADGDGKTSEGEVLSRIQYGNTTKSGMPVSVTTAVLTQVMKVILIFASLLTLVPVMARADEVIVRHDRNVVEQHHYRHHYYRHHEVVVVHPN